MSRLSQLYSGADNFLSRVNWGIWLPVLLFTVIVIHGGFLGLGLTDDEAYYWVLAQKPALGYAYHPPAVAWWIALSQLLLSPLVGAHHELIVRFPSALTSAVFLALALHWLRRAGVPQARLLRSGLVLLSVAGLFSLSWMMVPDIPLFLGWTLALSATWEICFTESEERLRRQYFFLLFGITLALLSKYSAVLGALSALVAIRIWAPGPRKLAGWAAVIGGCLIAAVPIVIWNAQHEWVSILYQIRERHQGGSISLLRYARFWAVELLIAGPVLVVFIWSLLRSPLRQFPTSQFLLIWIAPAAAVFLVQPLFSDFKPHWALIVWWPLALAFAWSWGTDSGNRLKKRAKFQVTYGLSLGVLVLICCHFPVGGAVIKALNPAAADPRWDVTNDLYGWKELRSFVLEKLGPAALQMPVVGSRYQTASQAAFSIGHGGVGLLLPRGIRDKDEWPLLEVSETVGPDWPVLRKPVLFVADNRYDVGPEFPKTSCAKLGRIQKTRGEYLAKWIDVWQCEPGEGQLESKAGSHHQSL
ncbi:MAG: hypothetical protein A2070_07560 [Bdellovibrionales bacterium GWC1_52_8]|nr:MAG: hypothetical protein A2070_07560 [Bdellovibrionales bacterium GWC1_52_8]